MRVDEFDYHLPEHLIAQTPLQNRTDSRLLVVDRATGTLVHRTFRDICSYLHEGDALILNDTRVIPARLIGSKVDTGARIEFLLLRQLTADEWEVLVRPGKRLREHARVTFGDDDLLAEVIDLTPAGGRRVRFSWDRSVPFEAILDRLGTMPLPPYIHARLDDQDRYQTVFAQERGSAAAPTAGLHFTEELLEEIRSVGVRVGMITLHVGLGTFRPMQSETIEEHVMHAEYYRLSQETADLIKETKAMGGRVIAVGTTVTRTLETVGAESSPLKASEGWTDIFIYPGYQFRVVDGLLTNFHLPRSTLLMLVSAFSSRELIWKAYNEAVAKEYRFFSFGDAMLIL